MLTEVREKPPSIALQTAVGTFLGGSLSTIWAFLPFGYSPEERLIHGIFITTISTALFAVTSHASLKERVITTASALAMGYLLFTSFIDTEPSLPNNT
jgi:hypothetical protein